jgi:hypothetical protein
MTQQIAFQNSIGDTIVKYLRENLPQGYFKAFYYGDPYDIPESLMPACVVEKLKTDVIHGPTGMDKVTYTIMVKLLYCKKEDFGKTPDEELGIRFLENSAEGINPITGEYDSHTVAGILRKYFTLGQILTDQTMVINYGIVPRTGDVLTAEAHVTVAIDELRTVTGRQ